MKNASAEKKATLRQATLTAWAKLLYEEGKIDLQHYNRMLDRIQKTT